jgi:hypothetical protein
VFHENELYNVECVGRLVNLYTVDQVIAEGA